MLIVCLFDHSQPLPQGKENRAVFYWLCNAVLLWAKKLQYSFSTASLSLSNMYPLVYLRTSMCFCVLCVLTDWLQGSDCFLPVLYNGQLLLAPGGGPLSSCTFGCLFLLWEEVLLGLYPDRLGWGCLFVCAFFHRFVALGLAITPASLGVTAGRGRLKLARIKYQLLHFHVVCPQEVQQFS